MLQVAGQKEEVHEAQRLVDCAASKRAPSEVVVGLFAAMLRCHGLLVRLIRCSPFPVVICKCYQSNSVGMLISIACTPGLLLCFIISVYLTRYRCPVDPMHRFTGRA